MTKTQTILQAGKHLAATAAGRAFKGERLKTSAEDVLNDPTAEKQDEIGTKAPAPGHPAPKTSTVADKEAVQDPGNPNAVNHDDQDPGQEKG